MSTENPDRIYAVPQDIVTGFTFDRQVARVFSDMIRRSVPGYGTIISQIGVLAASHVQPASRCYDLGCSLGASSLAMSQQINADDCQIIAIDNSEAMIESARQQITHIEHQTPIELICSDILNIAIENASMVVLNLTLQFIPVEQRQALIEHIYNGLRPGGILVLSEKIQFEDQKENQLQTEMHHAFKRANGYNQLEISQKRAALENVLIPETLQQHRDRLSKAGFQRTDLWFQCFNFISLIARKA
ncbi:MAG: carboxy-S-adenosyl-L-methionine synthase CmoA [Gammaproteobacteria bacterium]|nr:carboxy-S-adenosyl-L-methionine synthase CmoA [Gammaproteobacteria bacterium]